MLAKVRYATQLLATMMLWNVMSGIGLRATVGALAQMVDAPVNHSLQGAVAIDLGTVGETAFSTSYGIGSWLIKSLTHVE